MERMKSNCRKAAMETRQQHFQVDLVKDWYVGKQPKNPVVQSLVVQFFALLLNCPFLPNFKRTGECVLSNLKPENMWSIKSEWFLLLQTVATPQCLKI
ncbi:uncharacterized protein [Pyrus communis]|uniref:uncharacterized protein isoform X2 n=1 Tax=Pyrus communis TaxID=23211 RepID=UPI0035C002FE